jgi:hypothetical protein
MVMSHIFNYYARIIIKLCIIVMHCQLSAASCLVPVREKTTLVLNTPVDQLLNLVL